MTYLGNTPTTQSFISGTDYFNGTGSQTAFTLSRTVASVNDIEAVVNNVVQQPNDAYTISGTTITFTSAPSAGTNNVYVRYLSTTTQAITPSQNTVSWNTLDSNTQQDLGISFKNKIINGNMVIDQRNAGASVTVDSTKYTVDRWRGETGGATGGGVFTAQQSSVAPVGFTNSLLCTVTTTDTSLGTGDLSEIAQIIEGFNVADLGWGTANAKTVTLSFWVRSSVTGSYSIGFQNNGNNRSYVAVYTVNAANTWEYKTITVTGDTSGTWLTNNGIGLQIRWCFATGSARVAGSANAWSASNSIAVSGTTNPIMGTLGATFYITGVQLEVGTQATTFTLAGGSYGAELALCQRYFQVLGSGTGKPLGFVGYFSSTGLQGNVQTKVTMRTAPTFSIVTGTNFYIAYTASNNDTFNSVTLDFASPDTVQFFNNTEASGTANAGGSWATNNASAFIALQAEL